MPGTVVLFGLLYVDAAGIPYLENYALSELRASSNVPIFSFYESELGLGTVGGSLLGNVESAAVAANIASRTLRGEWTKDDRLTRLNVTAPRFDWRELKRFNIDEARLPPGSEVLFRPPTMWEQHKQIVLAAVALLVVQSGLIVALVAQRSRRRRAEGESSALSGRLLTVHEDERRRLARELHDDVTQRLARLAIDAARLESGQSMSTSNQRPTVHADLVRLSDDVHALSYRLHPSILDDLGLEEALKAECEHVARQGDVRVDVDVRTVPNKLPQDVALCIFRVAQEALRNVVRHAHASVATVTLMMKNGGLILEVGDNGHGFESANLSDHPSLGHASMEERIRLVRGRLQNQEHGRARYDDFGVGAAGVGRQRERGMKRPRVLLADDHRLVAEGLKSLLEEEFELLGVVEDGRDLVESAKRLRPDVIVADISMPHLNGIDALALLKKDNPDVRVVFLTMHKEAAYARRALEAGASGYVLKHSAQAELFLAVRAALEGKVFITPALAGEVFRDMKSGQPQPADPVAALTPRQREILQLVAEGRSTKEIASQLDISPRTVEFHKYQLMNTLKLQGNAELVHFAIKNGIVSI